MQVKNTAVSMTKHQTADDLAMKFCNYFKKLRFKIY